MVYELVLIMIMSATWKNLLVREMLWRTGSGGESPVPGRNSVSVSGRMAAAEGAEWSPAPYGSSSDSKQLIHFLRRDSVSILY